MYFILEDDIESDRHYVSGELLSMSQMMELLSKCEVAKAQCFASEQLALEWNACQ
jgi:hypothetical protein